MNASGIEFYDDEKTFEAYWRGRRDQESENDTLERPMMLQLLGDVQEKRILDLGCGAGELGHELLARGARSYVGLEGSRRMVAAAQDAPNFQVLHGDLAAAQLPPGPFDLVISSLVFHYLPDLQPLFEAVSALGTPFVFSVEHPLITAEYPPEGAVDRWVVDHYFDRGARQQAWKGGRVTKYHRTLGDYFSLFRQARLVVDDMQDAEPRRENFVRQDTYEARRRYPLFLFFATRSLTQ